MKSVAFVRATGIFDDSRATKEIIALAQGGYRVCVLSWDRYGNAREKNRKVFGDFPNVRFFYFSARIPNGIGLRNLDKLLQWNWWIRKTIEGLDGVDYIHICNLDSGLFVGGCLKRKGAKLVYDIFDYYVDSHSIPAFLRSWVEKLETSLINRADLCIICTEERMEQLEKSRPRKVCVIHNAPDVPALEAVSQEQYDYSYCGSFGARRLLWEILSEYPSHANFRFCFAGYGDYVEKCRELTQYSNFTFAGSIPYGEVLDIEAKSRVISAIYEPSIRNHRLCAPNKFYEGLALGKPIIVCRGTGIDRIVERERCGVVISYSAEEFYAALDYLIRNPEECAQMGYRGRQLYLAEYAWSRMQKRLLRAYEEIGE